MCLIRGVSQGILYLYKEYVSNANNIPILQLTCLNILLKELPVKMSKIFKYKA